ncbi:MAG: TlpA disulfide reductase family protein [Chitinophagaceae bacterium]
MKNLMLLFCFSGITSSGISKNDTLVEASKTVKTIVEIKDNGGKNDKSFGFLINLDSFDNNEKGAALEGVYFLRKDSTLKFTTSIDHPVRIMLKGFSEGLLLEPGDSICVNIRTGVGNKAIISGSGSEKWRCWQTIIPALHLVTQNEADELLYPDSLLEYALLNIQKFGCSMSRTSYTTTKADFWAQYINDADIYFSNNSSAINTLKGIAWYQQYKKYFNRFINIMDPNLNYSKTFINALPKMVLLEYIFKQKNTYKNILFSLLPYERYKIVRDFLNNTPLKNRVLTHYLSKQLLYESFTEIKLGVIDFLNHDEAKESCFHKAIEEKYNQYNTKLNKGQPAYAFALPDTNNNMVHMEDFKGKVVLFDFMFSGCGGCMQMVPTLTKVEQHFNTNNNVVFVSVSADKDVEKFKQYHRKGVYSVPTSIPLYTKGDEYNGIIKFYEPQFPTLTLIGKNGKIFSNRAPDPRPDNGKALIELINKALEEEDSSEMKQ